MSKYLELISEILGGIQIVFFPLLVGLIIGSMVYFSNPTFINLIMAIIIGIIGLLLGIMVAIKIYKSKKGTIEFLSKIYGSPKLEEKNSSFENQKK